MAPVTAHISGPLGLRISEQYRDIQLASKSLAACHRDDRRYYQTHAFLPSLANIRQLFLTLNCKFDKYQRVHIKTFNMFLKLVHI
jgi:hypothetical protein